MRESSLTLPSSIGTLKSTRTRTLLPASVDVADGELLHGLALGAGAAWSGAAGRGGWWPGVRTRRRAAAARRESRRSATNAIEVGDAAAVAPLVVVPGDDLDHACRRSTIVESRVDDRRARVAAEVGRDERLVADAEDALHRARRGGAERVVELLGGRSAAPARAVKSTTLTVGRRHAQAEAVELALELRDDERERAWPRRSWSG